MDLTPERLTGVMGSAEPITAKPERRDEEATVAAWLIESRATGMPWWQFGLAAVHLRPIEGVAPAHVWFPEATHELMVFAYDPGGRCTPERVGAPLEPASYAAQFTSTDDAVRQMVPSLVRKCLDGMLHLEPKPTAATLALAAAGKGPWLADRRGEWGRAIASATGSIVRDQWGHVHVLQTESDPAGGDGA